MAGRPTMSYEWVVRIKTMYCSPEAYMLPDIPTVEDVERKLAELYPPATYGETPSANSIKLLLEDISTDERVGYRNRWH